MDDEVDARVSKSSLIEELDYAIAEFQGNVGGLELSDSDRSLLAAVQDLKP